jgi:type III restriction enzyme
MLKEGWDVRNNHRRLAPMSRKQYSPEQTGRYFAGCIREDTTEYVSVVAQKRLWTSWTDPSEGVELERKPMGSGTAPKHLSSLRLTTKTTGRTLTS